MMNNLKFTLLLAFTTLFAGSNLKAHNVWAHNSFVDPCATLAFYTQAGEVYVLLEEMKTVYRDANTNLEYGVIAEFRNKLIKSKKAELKSHKLMNTLDGYTKLRALMDKFDVAVKELEKINNENERVKKWDDALKDILVNDAKSFERINYLGKRYADIGGVKKKKELRITNINGILGMWRSDLKILKTTLDQVIPGLRNAIPLAEKGDFAAVMLSGRNAFGDKNPQFTDMFSAYQRMYVSTVLSTIAATMQSYPAGYEWLNNSNGVNCG